MIWASLTLAFLRCSKITYARKISFALGLTFLPTLCHFILVWLARSKYLFSSRILRPTFTVEGTRLLLSGVTGLRSYFLAARPSGPRFSFQSCRLLTRLAVVHLLRDAAHHPGLPYKSLKGHL